MKNNRGITLTSLIIYIIGMTLVIATITTLTTYFYKNVNIEEISDDSATQYTKFTSIFTEEINKESNRVVDSKILKDEGGNTEESYIIFSSGNQYTFKKVNKSIYKNNIKICENIETCDFSYTFVDSIYKIKVNLKTKSIDMTGDNAITYIIK